jgi:hypothetical protein
MADPKPPGAEQYDERYWAKFRTAARKRTSAQMGLPVGAFIAFVAVLKILEPMDYPVGDVRNSIEFRLVFYGAIVLFGLVVAIRGLRSLLEERWKHR